MSPCPRRVPGRPRRADRPGPAAAARGPDPAGGRGGTRGPDTGAGSGRGAGTAHDRRDRARDRPRRARPSDPRPPRRLDGRRAAPGLQHGLATARGRARNIRRIQPAPDGSRVDIWLWTGARITDTCDRITLSGPVDAIAVDEIAAAVQRRGWRSVSLNGGLDFQRRAALALAVLDPPIAVARSQLGPEDLAEVEAACASRLAGQAAEAIGIRI